MSSTIADLASRLNLSKGTVSRILNAKGGAFSEETRRRVFALANEMGYHPHPVARALATGRTGFIGLWVPELRTAYLARVAHQMEDHLERHGYHVFITLYGKLSWSQNSSSAQVMPPALAADGIIVHEIRTDAWDRLLGPLARRLPIVTTGVWCPNETVDYVGIDLSPASLTACRMLVASGRRRIAYLTEHLWTRRGDPRYEAYRTVMDEAGLPQEFIETTSQDRATVRADVRAYVAAYSCPEAIFCHNDDTAIATYRSLCDMGLRVPDDVALVGCDGVEDTEYLPTPITTIVQPLAGMSRIAARYMERRREEPDAPPQRTMLQSELVLRESFRP